MTKLEQKLIELGYKLYSKHQVPEIREYGIKYIFTYLKEWSNGNKFAEIEIFRYSSGFMYANRVDIGKTRTNEKSKITLLKDLEELKKCQD